MIDHVSTKKANLENNKVNLVLEADPPVTCRQHAPICYDMNASIYIWKREVLFNQEKLYADD